MSGQDADVIAALTRWQAAGHGGALVTLARTWGSAPRAPGSWLAVRDDGLLAGSVSGGCVEDDLVTRMREGRIAGSQPQVLHYGGTPDDARRFGLPCGGILEVVVEPAPDLAQLATLGARVAAGQLVARHVDLTTGSVTLDDAVRGDALSWNGEVLRSIHGPQRRLLIIGAGPISHYLALTAPTLDYAVYVCDPRDEYAAEWNVPGSHWIDGMPDDAVTALALDPHSAVVALTHDPKLDDMALLEALKSPAFYVGAVGSRANNARRRERLAQHFDLSADELARLRGPVGLPIGSHTPPEIAIAILADLVAVSHGVRVDLPASSDAPSTPCLTPET